MAVFAEFPVTLSVASAVDVTVQFNTADMGITEAYGDYTKVSRTVVIPAGATQVIVRARVRASTGGLTTRQFIGKISQPVNVLLGSPVQQTIQIAGPPAYPAVPFPGRRFAMFGDSILYANNHWNPALPQSQQGPVPAVRSEYYSTGMTGCVAFANAILGNPFELEPGVQPNTNPGANATSPFNGYNFAVYSSQVAQWDEVDFDPLVETPVAHNRGPFYNGMQYLDSWDCALIMGGTNDLSANLSPITLFTEMQAGCYPFAQAGKWLFIAPITPRTADLLQKSATGAGYTGAEIQGIMQNILQYNDLLKSWLTDPDNPVPNMFYVDVWDALVGPQSSILSVPTDPAGLLSPNPNLIVSGALLPSTPGNYDPDDIQTYVDNTGAVKTIGLQNMMDGLHFAPPGSYKFGKVLATTWKAAGVPSAVLNSLGGSTLSNVLPLKFGPNLMVHQNMVTSTNANRAPSSPLILGRSIGLGPPVAVSGFTAPTMDAHTNQGAGYQFGPVPDGWFVWRANSGFIYNPATDTTSAAPQGSPEPDNESFSNARIFTFQGLNQNNPDPTTRAPDRYLGDATWPDGCLQTSFTAAQDITIDGVKVASQVKGWNLKFNCPAGSVNGNTDPANSAYTVRYYVAEGQHNVWDSFGFEGGSSQAPWPSPPYRAGDALQFQVVVRTSGLSNNLTCMRLVVNFLCIDQNNPNTNSAVISSIVFAESFFPFNLISVCHHPAEDRTMLLLSPIVKAPTPASGETVVYAEIQLEISYDCQTIPAAGTITLFDPKLRKVTDSTGAVPSL